MSVVEDTLSRARKRKSADPIKRTARQVAQSFGAFVAKAPTREFPMAALDTAVLEQNCVLPQVADRAAMHSYKILRTRLLHRLAAENPRSLAVTSTKPGEGNTLTSINLAVALSREQNTRVCLVDLDLLRPQVAIQLGLDGARGLDDYLLGDAEPLQVMYGCGSQSLIVILSRHASHPTDGKTRHSPDRGSGSLRHSQRPGRPVTPPARRHRVLRFISPAAIDELIAKSTITMEQLQPDQGRRGDRTPEAPATAWPDPAHLGSVDALQTLMKDDLIDEYRLFIYPVVGVCESPGDASGRLTLTWAPDECSQTLSARARVPRAAALALPAIVPSPARGLDNRALHGSSPPAREFA